MKYLTHPEPLVRELARKIYEIQVTIHLKIGYKSIQLIHEKIELDIHLCYFGKYHLIRRKRKNANIWCQLTWHPGSTMDNGKRISTAAEILELLQNELGKISNM